MSDTLAVLARLHVLAHARNRDVDHDERTITLTDDDALLVLDAVGQDVLDSIGLRHIDSSNEEAP